MVRSFFFVTAMAVVATTAGCRMCAHPYDYCGPTFTGDDCTPCAPLARAGSAFSPDMQPGPVMETAPDSGAEPGKLVPVPDPTVKTSPPAPRPAQQSAQVPSQQPAQMPRMAVQPAYPMPRMTAQPSYPRPIR